MCRTHAFISITKPSNHSHYLQLIQSETRSLIEAADGFHGLLGLFDDCTCCTLGFLKSIVAQWGAVLLFFYYIYILVLSVNEYTPFEK